MHFVYNVCCASVVPSRLKKKPQQNKLAKLQERKYNRIPICLIEQKYTTLHIIQTHPIQAKINILQLLLFCL